jgi:hypothetical protein
LRDYPRQRVIGDGSVRPHRIEDLLLGKDVPGPRDEQREQVERFGFERQWRATAFDPEGVKIEYEVVPAVSHERSIASSTSDLDVENFGFTPRSTPSQKHQDEIHTSASQHHDSA